MSGVKLDQHGKELLQQYRELRPTLDKLSSEAYDLLRHELRKQGIYVTAIEHRVKTEKSLAGKLELKGSKYKTIDDIINGQNETNEMLADLMLEQAKTLSFMQEKK